MTATKLYLPLEMAEFIMKFPWNPIWFGVVEGLSTFIKFQINAVNGARATENACHALPRTAINGIFLADYQKYTFFFWPKIVAI